MKYIEEKKLTKILYTEREVAMPIEQAREIDGFVSYKNGIAIIQDEYYDLKTWLSVVALKTFSSEFGMKTRGEENDTVYNAPDIRISDWRGNNTFFENELVGILNEYSNTPNFYYKIAVNSEDWDISNRPIDYTDDINYIADRHRILTVPETGNLHSFVAFLINNNIPFYYSL